MGIVEATNGIIAIVLFLGFFVACAGLSMTVASQKGYEKPSWFMAGLFLGPLGLIAAAGLPDRKNTPAK